MRTEHATVFHGNGKFAGWPANNGVWSYGDEILVSYVVGTYQRSETNHSIDFNGLMQAGFGRSTDGGRTWENTVIPPLYDDPVKSVPEGGFDFTAPGFALRVGRAEVAIKGRVYLVSSDRGRTWSGPYALPDFGFDLTCRTCYLVLDAKTLLIFMSKKTDEGEGFSDRAFCAKTTDGGVTWRFMGYMTDDMPRSVMPAVVRLPEGTLVAALRRRLPRGGAPKTEDVCWIETCISRDGGITWNEAFRAADTGSHNGNPPALALAPDGRIVLAYGHRGVRSGDNYMALRISEDGGRSFGGEQIVRNDACTFDMGYPRLVFREDGRAVLMYYYKSDEYAENYIAASIIDL